MLRIAHYEPRTATSYTSVGQSYAQQTPQFSKRPSATMPQHNLRCQFSACQAIAAGQMLLRLRRMLKP